MDKELLADLMLSMKEAIAISKGEITPSRSSTVQVPPDLSLEQRLAQFDPTKHDGELLVVEPLGAEKARSTGIPQAVVEAHVMREVPLICAWREELGLTQEELAVRLGLSQAAVAKFERPNAHPRTCTLNKIALALGISVEQLNI